MKKIRWVLAVLSSAGILLLAAPPAGANDVTSISVNCERVTVNYAHFPADVAVTTSVTVGKDTRVFVDKTVEGSGILNNQLDLNGHVDGTVSVSWNLDGEHNVGKPFSFDCGTPETTTTTVPETPTTTVPTPTTSVPSSTPTSPPNANPPELPRTGGWAIVGATAVGLAFIGIGIAIQKKD